MINVLKPFYTLTFYLVITVLTMTPNDLQAFSNGTANIGNDYTGSPLSTGNCSLCHVGNFYGDVNAVITVVDETGVVVSGFIARETYMITVEVTNTENTPSKYGFQLTLMDEANNFLGTFSTPSAGSDFLAVNNQVYWAHVTSSDSNSFTILWDAPVAMTTVNIYATALAVNNDGGTLGDSASASSTFSASLSLPADWIFGNGFE